MRKIKIRTNNNTFRIKFFLSIKQSIIIKQKINKHRINCR